MIEGVEQKRYRHFDAFLTEKELLRIINDPMSVARNKFFPFLGYIKEISRFSGSQKSRGGKSRLIKPRNIRYASRRDSAIFQAYRTQLLPLYEDRLRSAGIDEAVIAYRKIPIPERPQAGKCNIHHACDVFLAINRVAPCVAIALDIEGFFESIDHVKLYSLWCELLSVKKLPPDHLAVFKNVTKYSVVDLDDVLEKLGYLPDDDKIQLCSPAVFREKIVPLITQNPNTFGIPQGSPISDLLANLILLNFDIEVTEYVKKTRGVYRRYSDDIVLILPFYENTDHQELTSDAINFVSAALHRAGKELKIKHSKTCVGVFDKNGQTVTYVPMAIKGAEFKNKPFEYLGFSFNGTRVLLRNPTVSGLFRKLTWHTESIVREIVRRFPNKSLGELSCYIKPKHIIERHLKVEGFADKVGEYENWTFWSYAKRCHEVMSGVDVFDSGILRQLARTRMHIGTIIIRKLPVIFQKVKADLAEIKKRKIEASVKPR